MAPVTLAMAHLQESVAAEGLWAGIRRTKGVLLLRSPDACAAARGCGNEQNPATCGRSPAPPSQIGGLRRGASASIIDAIPISEG